MKFINGDGSLRVETAVLSLTGGPRTGSRGGPDGGDGAWYIVSTKYRQYVGQCRTVAGLATLGVDLADLTEVS